KFADKFMAALRLDMPFSIENGVLRGVDIEQAATRLSKHGTTGGETRFETLSGHLVLQQRSYHFTQLRISSGSLAVDGAVNISPKKELAGRINARVNVMGASASVPLNVTGTVDDPTLLPTGAAMTGAAVGTVLLGPGLGTAVGVKVGDWVDNLFGAQNKPKKKPK
ncbi:MAG: AsmA family protein, partial [Gallionellales bacterium CG_4_8_14_3_um_filter_54_18]